MYKVYVSDYVFENLEPERAILKEAGAEVIGLKCKDSDELKEKAKDADALLNSYLSPIDGAVMDAMKGLKVIVRYGIGYDSIDVEAATRRGIQVANVPDYCLEEVSDHAVALALSLVRKIPLSWNRIREKGEYSLGHLKPVLPLQEADVTILGFGRIGKLIAKKFSPFGCRLRFYDPFIGADYREDGVFAQKVSLEEAWAGSDVIVLQAPATKENYHMMGEEAFAMMEKKPYIVNTARGELMDREALVKALEEGRIAGAALDVVEGMPPVDREDKLLQFENVILTPHSAWVSENSLVELQRLAAREVAWVLKGGEARNLVNPGVRKKG